MSPLDADALLTRDVAPRSQRLWSSLSASLKRTPPAQGFDVLGERVAAWFQRRKAARLPWARAQAIMHAAGQIRDCSQAQLDDRIHAARDLVLTLRDDPATVDTAFATAYEVIRREIGLSLHVEQVIGAIALASGQCAELATGEGKTITAILPAALDGWSGRGVHVVTVNDYLARRDAETTSPAYQRLGLSVGVIQDSTTHDARKRAYAADITYAADKQVIFDHLRDRLASPLAPRLVGVLLDELAPVQASSSPPWHEKVVHRGLYAAIIDEADSVLIDEAITPAIIAQPGAPQDSQHFALAASLASKMVAGSDYIADLRLRRVSLTSQGRTLLAEQASNLPAFWAGPRRREELLTQALTAKELYLVGRDYIVAEGDIAIVDRSTGRVLPGRQWQLGLHQAIQAKEGVPVTTEHVVAARTSYQGFFRRYQRLSGMTGTASEVASELWRWYRLPVVRVPTHRPVLRTVEPDRIFSTATQKLEAAADAVTSVHATGRPVLVGTWSVNTSERIGELLRQRGVSPQVLNATRESEEAAIVERAGMPWAVTVATNMAGRGTDIRLTPESRAKGGLLVVSTERHDEPRVDRQLAGRAGRQGDPGGVLVFVSLQDELILQSGPRTLAWLVHRTRGPARSLLAKLLWAAAQFSASRKWATIRAEVAKADAWLEMAMHQRTR